MRSNSSEKPNSTPGFGNSVAGRPPHLDDKRPEKADLAKWKCEMKEEHVNETKEEINSIKRQIFGGCIRGVCGYGMRRRRRHISQAAPVATEAASRAVPSAAAAAAAAAGSPAQHPHRRRHTAQLGAREDSPKCYAFRLK